jgi:hypothetical protein
MPTDRLYHVLVNQVRTEDTLLPGNAGLQEVHVIPYSVDSGPAKGHSGTIRVPTGQETPAEVDRLIRAKIGTLHEYDKLGGAPVMGEAG